MYFNLLNAGEDLKDLEVEKFIKSMKNEKINLYGIVNNASRYFINSLSKTSDEEFLKIFKTNFLTPFKIIKNLKIEKGGFIINIGLVGLFKNLANIYFPAYFISKQALLTATKSFAREFLEKNIRVNMVSPGILETSIL